MSANSHDFYISAHVSFVATMLPEYDIALCSKNFGFIQEWSAAGKQVVNVLREAGIAQLVGIKNPADVLNLFWQNLKTQCKSPSRAREFPSILISCSLSVVAACLRCGGIGHKDCPLSYNCLCFQIPPVCQSCNGYGHAGTNGPSSNYYPYPFL